MRVRGGKAIRISILIPFGMGRNRSGEAAAGRDRIGNTAMTATGIGKGTMAAGRIGGEMDDTTGSTMAGAAITVSIKCALAKSLRRPCPR